MYKKIGDYIFANQDSGKDITSYSFRHTYITMRLSAGLPIPTIAANTDTSMKYIQEHYFHLRADESTEILGKGRKMKPAGKVYES